MFSPEQTLKPIRKKNMFTNANDSKIWKAALKMEGLDIYGATDLEDHEISMISDAMSLISKEMIELRDALDEHLTHNDHQSGMKLRNVLNNTLLTCENPKGNTMEEVALELLQQVEE